MHNLAVSEPGVSEDHDSPLAFSAWKAYRKIRHPLWYLFTGHRDGIPYRQCINYLDEPNGSMKGGDPGIRLIEPAEKRSEFYFKINTRESEYQKDEILVVPVYLIFGSEELSAAGDGNRPKNAGAIFTSESERC